MSGDNRRWDRKDSRRSNTQKVVKTAEDELESKLGFGLFSEGETRLGWLLTFASSSWEDPDTGKTYSCVDLYFVTQDGFYFKTKYKFRPYFYAATKEKMELEVEAYLRRRYERQVADIEIVEKEDLDLKNHLSGLRKKYLKVSFDTVQQLMEVKRDLSHIVERNQAKFDALEAYESILAGKREQRLQDCLDSLVDLREYDVPYHVRFAVDKDVRSGQWYNVSISSTDVTLEKRTDILQRAEVRVCAFDIETTKLELKFPDAEYDQIMMISYMVDGLGFLIVNRECVGEDIEDLEYTPKPEFEGYFKVTNVSNEVELLRKWFSHMQEVKPGIYVTYNGDFFDWPFIERRASHHEIKMNEELGFRCDHNQGECRAKFVCHLDCFAWVKRDSYLPQGSHGLKAVTKAKLGYDPLEVNPEDMVQFAMEKPQTMASYSVSDAVATYYLYMTYVHPFIFSLATIIPMVPDEVLRKGSGTLCEMLLMVEAYNANVICPNKNQADPEKFHKSHLLESETYIGGHVECLESGVFRSDIPTSFKLDTSAYQASNLLYLTQYDFSCCFLNITSSDMVLFKCHLFMHLSDIGPFNCQQLIDNLDRDLEYAITVEGKMRMDSVSNYDEVKEKIKEKLEKLRDYPIREEGPLIYHLDVAAMYPNIILTNRLQPPSIVTNEICTACDFNRPGKTCLRKLEWVWRGVTFMAKKSDYYHLKKQIESEFVDTGANIQSSKSFLDLPKVEQQSKLKDRLKKYCQKAYRRVLDKPDTEIREAGICMRENPFYVDTVRSFRDRRYEYKTLNKVWKGKLSEAKASGNSIKIQEAQDMVVVYDSLQLAHKCILNSFYGYVMRKGARWYSMEMAGVVTYTGAKIIQNARLLIERIGRPLELDTDGIWCALPGSFPENFTFKTIDMKKFTISYPCVMLNVDVAKNNTNDQYQTLVDPVRKTYESHSECSIEFEVDGPYKAMIIPASKEEGVLLKKRYAVFNHDGTLAELKGFEIKRRGELKLIKVFQQFEERMKFYLGKWCKQRLSSDHKVDIRLIIDWSYYKQRLSSAIQKVITIPAAMQKVANPVPRVLHPDWLHKKVREKDDKFRQRKLADMFSSANKDGVLDKNHSVAQDDVNDIEDFCKENKPGVKGPKPVARSYEVNKEQFGREQQESNDPKCDDDISFENIDKNVDYQGWLEVRKRKWKGIVEKKKKRRLGDQRSLKQIESHEIKKKVSQVRRGVGSFFRRPEEALTSSHWQATNFRSFHSGLTFPIFSFSCREENSGPTVVVIECPDFNSIKDGIKALDDFPCVRIPFNGDDNSYQPVSWQRPAAKLAMFRCAAAFQWLDRRISQSRYAHVPLGNFGLDWLTFTVDIFLSRALRDQQQVLWVSDNGVPDLGGLNNEETFFADEVQQTSLVYPGAYRKISVELMIHHLAVDALLKSNLVSEMEGGDFLGFEQDGNPRGSSSNANSSFDETTGCAQAFRVLKQLIHSCLTDVCKSRNIYADSILQRLSWWLCSPCSKLHDPALHLMLHKVMQKVFALLLTDLRRLGATIIFADFSKIVIDTGKFDLSAAKAYCDSLLTAVGNSDIFEWISLEPAHYWHSLLFMDQYNYAGIQATDDEISPDEVTIEPKWSVARLFPEYIQRDFVIIVAKFIFDPWKFSLEKKRGSSESLEAQMVEYLKEQIPSSFFNMLVAKINDIVSHMKEMDVSDASRDSQASKRDYALELVQTICAVMGLDQNVEQDVRTYPSEILFLKLCFAVKLSNEKESVEVH
ncbi:hypothetical protein F2Q70_00019606 [Brassica cretica]|uniref:DNA polymerase epsilon catalytic subunit n=1 Tax=Brassica cretica TaxID=69181 RepID=A0A8S9GQS2_BRACR|nr:hypothetical protein F2Q70_00019606 [Brassica cretica]